MGAVEKERNIEDSDVLFRGGRANLAEHQLDGDGDMRRMSGKFAKRFYRENKYGRSADLRRTACLCTLATGGFQGAPDMGSA